MQLAVKPVSAIRNRAFSTMVVGEGEGEEEEEEEEEEEVEEEEEWSERTV